MELLGFSKFDLIQVLLTHRQAIVDSALCDGTQLLKAGEWYHSLSLVIHFNRIYLQVCMCSSSIVVSSIFDIIVYCVKLGHYCCVKFIR